MFFGGGGNKLLDTKCVLIFSTNLSETFLILRTTERDMIKKISISVHVKYPSFLSDFNKNLNFLGRFSKNTRISHFMKNFSLGGELFHADRRTNIHDGNNSRLSQFCERV